MPSIDFVAVVIPLWFSNAQRKRVIAKCRELAAACGEHVHVDDREEPLGTKFYQWDEARVPIRVELGPKALLGGQVRVRVSPWARDTTYEDVLFAEVPEYIRKYGFQ